MAVSSFNWFQNFHFYFLNHLVYLYVYFTVAMLYISRIPVFLLQAKNEPLQLSVTSTYSVSSVTFHYEPYYNA